MAQMTPEQIATQMVQNLGDGRFAFRDGSLVRHGYAVDEPHHVLIHIPGGAVADAFAEYHVRKIRERIANLVREVRAEGRA